MKATSCEQLVRRMTQPDLAAAPPGGELQPREGVDGRHVGLDAADVAEDEARLAALEQRADTVAEAGQVGTRDRPRDRERERVRL